MPAIEISPPAADRQRLPCVSFGPFSFDTHTRLLSRGGQEVALPPRVLGVLELLLRRAGDVVTRQELIDAVWKDAFVTDTSLAEAVSVLRQALADDSQSPTFIQTLHRRGYRFVAPVSTIGPTGRTEAPVPANTPVLAPSISPSIGGQLVPWSAAVICALIAAAAVWHLTRGEQAGSAPAVRFTLAPAPGTRFDDRAPALAFSADGTQLAWSACDGSGCRIYVRPLDRLEPSAIPGTDDGHAPFFSPDGRWIAFFADGRLKKVALAGGAPVTLADAPSILGGTWSDREIIFAGSSTDGLQRISADGGDPRPLTTPREADGEIRHAWPSLVPNRRVLLFTIETMPAEGPTGVMSALSLDAAGASAATRWPKLVAGVNLARAAAPDTIVFARGSELDVIAFDPIRLAVAGAPRAIPSLVATARGRAHYALSSNGSLVAAVTPGPPSPADAPGLAWWSRSGFLPATEEVRRLRAATLSPDGTRVAGVNVEGAGADIWVADVLRGTASRLTHSGVNTSPIWSADGRTIYFASRTDGAFEIWSRDAEGTQPAARRFSSGGAGRHSLPLAVSPDGTMLVFRHTDDRRGGDLWMLPLGEGPPRPLVQGPFDDGAASVSPDSAMLAFQSAETGRWEIYLLRLRDGRRMVVSTDGGERPVWSQDGLYFQSRGRLVRARIADAQTFRIDAVDEIADLQGAALQGVSPDGRILVERGTDLSHGTAVVNLEWLREARALLGPPATALPR
jgi:DNA-binding winged helix-turn-helix (wHTH) protein/Tol biopolymer transport system component